MQTHTVVVESGYEIGAAIDGEEDHGQQRCEYAVGEAGKFLTGPCQKPLV